MNRTNATWVTEEGYTEKNTWNINERKAIDSFCVENDKHTRYMEKKNLLIQQKHEECKFLTEPFCVELRMNSAGI